MQIERMDFKRSPRFLPTRASLARSAKPKSYHVFLERNAFSLLYWCNCIDGGLRAFFHLILKPNTVHHWTDSKGTGGKPLLLSSVCESSDPSTVEFAGLIKPFYLYIIYRNRTLFLEIQVAWRNISTYINAVVTSEILNTYY